MIELEKGWVAAFSRSGRVQGKICIDMCDNFLLYGKKLPFHLRREGAFHTADPKDVMSGKDTNDCL
ncbi:MAG: hypothetical protein H6Q41_492 [Deltaproteobacteria bacterium]|nr:hypothetical protein [Deltaproteobacteria bacterium]